jgi:D-alanyl-D-alanine carboxypeptidase
MSAQPSLDKIFFTHSLFAWRFVQKRYSQAVMMKMLFSIVFILGILQPVAQAKTNNIQAAIDEAQKNGNLPGIAVLVQAHGKNIYFHAQGKRALGHKASVQTKDIWHLGSDTKAMTAYLIALAVRDQKVKYETRLVDFFGDKISFHELNKDLTLSDLLVHQSGLKDVQQVQGGKLWPTFFTSKEKIEAQRIEMVSAALGEEPHLDPKDPSEAKRSYSYANMNYIIAGAILEQIYGKSWEKIISQKLFKPLQMKSCGFGVAGKPNETEPSQPWAHLVQNNQLISVPPKEKLDNPAVLGPAGVVHCSLKDWNKFISKLSSFFNQNKVAKEFATAPGGFYTYGGWLRNDEKLKTPTFQHDGSNSFNYAVAFFAPEKEITILLATNTGTPEAAKAMGQLKLAILTSLGK